MPQTAVSTRLDYLLSLCTLKLARAHHSAESVGRYDVIRSRQCLWASMARELGISEWTANK